MATNTLELSRYRDNGELVSVNYEVLIRKLQLRGKPPAALRAAGVSYDLARRARA